MAFESFPNTPHNARAVTLAEHEQMTAPLGLSGLTQYGTGQLPVYADSTGRQVKLRAGANALIRGTRFNNLTETVLAVTANSSGNPRVDLVVLRLDRATYEITPVILAGTAGANPVAPTPVRNEAGSSPDYYDQPLAEIQVPNGAATTTATQVKNRAWWISGGGYLGLSTARPPVVAGTTWFETDTGIFWVGSNGGTYRRVYHNTGYTELNLGDTWTGTFALAREGNLVVASIRVQRTGSSYGTSSGPEFGPIDTVFRPDQQVCSVYQARSPGRTADLFINPNGKIVFTPDFQNSITTGTILTANPTWLASN